MQTPIEYRACQQAQQTQAPPDRAYAAQGLDRLYAGRPIQRFWFLETVARMPYFSYISMLHLYESLGWWRAGAELRRVRPLRSPFLGPPGSALCSMSAGPYAYGEATS